MQLRKSKEISHVPDHLNEQFFVDTLEEGLREMQIKVREVNFEWGSLPGENYCSSIYRVLVKYERIPYEPTIESAQQEKLSLILKVMPVTPETEFLQKMSAYIKEKIVYQHVLPRLEILMNGAQFGSKYYHAIKTPVQTLVFRDLKFDGFSVASRQQQLDWHHSELVLRQLGKFHAASMILIKRDPSLSCDVRFKNGFFRELPAKEDEQFKSLFGLYLKLFIAQISKWQGFEYITEKLNYYYDHFTEITAIIAKPRSTDRYTVLNHGDVWTNNILFAYDNAEQPQIPTQVLFVDFPMSFLGSPGCDLNYFLNTSVPLDILKTRRNELEKVYYAAFRATLLRLHYDDIPTLEDLQFEMRQREFYGLFALFGFFPMITMPKELSEDSTIEALANEEFALRKFEKVFSQEKLHGHFKYELKRMEKLGVFDKFPL